MLKQLQQAALAAQGTPPNFTQKPIVRQQGGNIVLECQLTSEPGPNVTWMLNGKVIMSGGRYLIGMRNEGNKYFISLQISDLTLEDGGEYKAVAKNARGEASATLVLTLEGED